MRNKYINNKKINFNFKDIPLIAIIFPPIGVILFLKFLLKNLKRERDIK